MQELTPPVKEMVLVGGGHAHVQVLKYFAMHPLPGLRISLVSREVHTPYSGMLPGYIAGFYSYDDIHIDLGPLARLAGARLIVGEVTGLDCAAKSLFLKNRPSLNYDLLSINSGAVPGRAGVELSRAMVRVKPIGAFLPQWQAIRKRTLQTIQGGSQVILAVVGGGAGGVELALAIKQNLIHAGADRNRYKLILITAGHTLLKGHSAGVRARLEHALNVAGVEVRYDFEVKRIDDAGLVAADGSRQNADHILWVTGVAAPEWLKTSGLKLDNAGFLRVNASLQAVADPSVFGAGDVVSLEGQARPKSGVFAVREGPVLARNLRRAALGRDLKPFRAQRRFLSILALGNGEAVASRGRLYAQGAWVWHWKDWIDKRFMSKFQNLPEMSENKSRSQERITSDLDLESMRCGGCGSKIEAGLLQRVLERLPKADHPHVDASIGDDAAVLAAVDRQLVISADSFRSMIDDPWVFGRVAVQHSLNDVYAMGADPVAALALASVPFMGAHLMQQDLYQMMAGAVSVLTQEGIALAGGHSSEGAELSLGFAVTGELNQRPLTKAGLNPGDALVLTRAIGSGVLLAGLMRGKTRTRWVLEALESMQASNRRAAQCFVASGVSSCTDVTGFGLLGHLKEMCDASHCGAEIELKQVPFYAGAIETMTPVAGLPGIESSLQQSNESVLAHTGLENCVLSDPRVRLLVDPQTAGGLLAGVASIKADACLRELQRLGYSDARIIGHVKPLDTTTENFRQIVIHA